MSKDFRRLYCIDMGTKLQSLIALTFSLINTQTDYCNPLRIRKRVTVVCLSVCVCVCYRSTCTFVEIGGAAHVFNWPITLQIQCTCTHNVHVSSAMVPLLTYQLSYLKYTCYLATVCVRTTGHFTVETLCTVSSSIFCFDS